VGPKVKGQRITLEEAWNGQKPSIDYLRIWGCKCYSYVNLKSLPALGRQDKLIDRGRVGVFVRYKENTTKQFRVYTLNLNYVIRSFIITFDELEKSSTINLRFRDIQNTLSDRKLKNRPRNKILKLKK
jgi:hypothetical protein